VEKKAQEYDMLMSSVGTKKKLAQLLESKATKQSEEPETVSEVKIKTKKRKTEPQEGPPLHRKKNVKKPQSSSSSSGKS